MVKGSRFVRCARVHPSTVAIDVTRYIKLSTYIKKLGGGGVTVTLLYTEIVECAGWRIRAPSGPIS